MLHRKHSSESMPTKIACPTGLSPFFRTAVPSSHKALSQLLPSCSNNAQLQNMPISVTPASTTSLSLRRRVGSDVYPKPQCRLWRLRWL
jgi:hypothetical protein